MSWLRKTPQGVYLAHTATVVGDVTIGRDSSIWFGAIVRGDVAPIILGERVNVQDGAIIHCDTGKPNVIEDDVSIAHRAVVHGARVERGVLIGIGATILGRSVVGEGCLVAAGAVVTPGTEVPPGMLVAGVPAKVLRPVSTSEREYQKWVSRRYVELAERYLAGEFDAGPWAPPAP